MAGMIAGVCGMGGGHNPYRAQVRAGRGPWPVGLRDGHGQVCRLVVSSHRTAHDRD